jgi:hypothetical protein
MGGGIIRERAVTGCHVREIDLRHQRAMARNGLADKFEKYLWPNPAIELVT